MLLSFISANVIYSVIYFIAAVAPAVVLWRYVYRKDMYEQEPAYLIRSLVIGGVLAVVVAIIFEIITDSFILPNMNIQTYEDYAFMTALTTALIEEGAKFFFLARRSWNSPEFNYRYDGLVYSVTVSLAFAAVENVLYVFQYGLSVALQRALLSIPAHMTFAVLMGIFYGRAKEMDFRRSGNPMVLNVMGLLAAIAAHTAYDASLMIGTDEAILFFVVFVIVMYIVVFRLIKREARTDHEII